LRIERKVLIENRSTTEAAMSNLAQPETVNAAPLRHPNQKYTRSREEAAKIISATIGAPFAAETLRKTEIPYALINSRVRYADADLLAHAERILSSALRRGRTPKPRKPNGQHETPAIEQTA
jgi:hypothetical protein